MALGKELFPAEASFLSRGIDPLVMKGVLGGILQYLTPLCSSGLPSSCSIFANFPQGPNSKYSSSSTRS